MEENKNNAMEKVENIISGTGQNKEDVKKNERLEPGEERKDNGEYKTKKHLKIAVLLLSIVSVVLASVLMVTYVVPSETQVGLENVYRKAFYDTVEQVDSIDANLSKAVATKDEGALLTYLFDTAINSELAESDVHQLPLRDESKYYTAKLVNQIGDFSKYLNKKIVKGESVSKEDRQNLNALYKENLKLKDALQKMMKEMKGDFSFLSMSDGSVGNAVTLGMNDLENLSVSYPELIYDGPFSDGITDRKVKGLSGEEITKECAVKIFKEIFSSKNVKEVSFEGETQGVFECYNVQGLVDGESLYAQISKTGGKLIMFAYSGSCKSNAISEDEAIKNAKDFLEKLGIKDIDSVWINLTGNVYTINMATVKDDVVVYPDLIKVRVCAETGDVIGIEASAYYTNHTERKVESPTLSVNEAKEKVMDDLKINTTRLSVVPVGTESETLCYEFSGEYDGRTYYVYIDAKTGRQVEMFKVIESTEGKLLI